MNITFTRRQILIRGLSEPGRSKTVPLGYFLFSEARCFFGVLKPYNLLKKVLLSGFLIDEDGNVLEWKPFSITRLQYADLACAIKTNPAWGGEVDESFRGSSKYWQRWAILRSLQPDKPLHRTMKQLTYDLSSVNPSKRIHTPSLTTPLSVLFQQNQFVFKEIESDKGVNWIWTLAAMDHNVMPSYSLNKKLN